MGRIQGDPVAVRMGWFEVGRVLGHYASTKKVVAVTELTQRVISQFDGMSDEELLALSAKAKH